jgi:hypothetical protein
LGGVGRVVEILREKVGGKESGVIRGEGGSIPNPIIYIFLIL